MDTLPRRSWLAIIGILGLAAGALAQQPEDIWQHVASIQQDRPASDAWIHPQKYHAFKVNHGQLRALLNHAGKEQPNERKKPDTEITLPMPDGTLARFNIIESPVMEPGLAAQFPEIKTYRGIGIDDPRASLRMDVTPAGMHAQILSPLGAIYIDPYWKNDSNLHTSYFKHDYVRPTTWKCLARGSDQEVSVDAAAASTSADIGIESSGGTLRTYRLACAADAEYTAFHGGTVAKGQAAVVTAINRVTQVYEVELAIRLVLVANNSSLVFVNSNTDPYTNDDGATMLDENQAEVDSVIGTANYDIGHVFSTGGGGIAGLGVVCVAGMKANGVTGDPSPTGDSFWIDYVAHEMGHEFGADHTFNSTTSSCGGGNRNATTAYEPGSGSTIMSYAGICDTDDLQPHSDPYFHSISYEQIMSYVGSAGCGTTSSTGNTAPNAPTNGGNFTIPARTPFMLTATGTDPDGDAVTFCWEERDRGSAQTVTAADNGASPIFRSFNPTTSPSRIFPKIQDILGATNSVGEKLPTTGRTLKFRVTTRDNRLNGGGVNSSATNGITVVSTAGPFIVTAPVGPTTLSGNATVTWNIANTTNTAINAANVNILLSTNGGVSFTTMLVSNTPNDGTQMVTLPNIATSAARIKVEATANIFFNISSNNFSIIAGGPVVTLTTTKAGAGDGTITSSPAGIDCGASCSSSFSSNTVVNLTATPDTNSAFTGWSGAASGSANPVAVTLNAAKTVTANFNAHPIVTSASITPVSPAFSDVSLNITGVVTSDPESNPVALAYQWQFTTNGTAYIDQAGATSTTLSLTPSLAGRLWRCRLTPSDTFGTGTNFFATGVTVVNRPNQLGLHNQSYSFQTALYLPVSGGGSFTRNAIINEFSQGTTGGGEWVELLFLKNSNAAGWKLFDSNSGTVTFSGNTLWSNITAGTVLVIYNGTAKDTVLPADDTDASDGKLLIAHSNATYFSGTWGALGNSGDSVSLSDSASTLIDNLSYGSVTTGTPSLGSVGGVRSASYTNDTEAGADVLANWQVINATNATPLTGNSGVNSNLIANLRSGSFGGVPMYRFGASGDTVAGLSINTTNGLISGTLNVPGGGFFNVVLERFSGSNVATQQYTLLVGDANGVFRIPAGKTWTLNTNYTIGGSLVVSGALDTAGHVLTVSNTLDRTAGTVNNPSPGVIYYGTLIGSALPGNSQQIAGSADTDGDGFTDAQENLAGTNPTDSRSYPAITLLTRSGNNMIITFATVAGKTYQVQHCTSLPAANWTAVTNFTASGNSSQATDTGAASGSNWYYRIYLVP